jgi:hypothetical protein
MRLLPSFLAFFLLMGTAVSPAAPRVEPPSFSWLAGHWCGGDAENPVEEHWLTPGGDVMLGIGRTQKNGRTASFEYLRIAPVDGVPTYFAHPGGRTATLFPLTEAGVDWVQFENLKHDFPQRIEYRRSRDTLRAQISGPGENGERVVFNFDFKTCNG